MNVADLENVGENKIFIFKLSTIYSRYQKNIFKVASFEPEYLYTTPICGV
jgi:hypothetical protein